MGREEGTLLRQPDADKYKGGIEVSNPKKIWIKKNSPRRLESCHRDVVHLIKRLFHFSPRCLKSGRLTQVCVNKKFLGLSASRGK